MKKVLLLIFIAGSFFSCKKEEQNNQIGTWKVAETYLQFDQDSLVHSEESDFTIELKNDGFGYWQPATDNIKFSWQLDSNIIHLGKTEDNLNLPYVIEYGSYEIINDEVDFQVWLLGSTLVSHILEPDTFILLNTTTEWELRRE